ncbi:heme-dependent oxidative N-demethylase family protein [Niveispirillum lacus]|nr:DUF3445 domain-containing protein [Niveispirillum lacus]
MTMGLRSQDPATWLAPDAGWTAQLTERSNRLRNQKWDVLALMPEGLDAAGECLTLVSTHLTNHFPGWFQRQADGIHSSVTGTTLRMADFDHPLHMAAHLQPDDLCLMTPSAGGWRLTGGAVCFPSHWFLPHMLGKPLPGIHRRVPSYATTLATPVDRFFDMLAAGRTVWRVNWTLADDPALFQPGTVAHKPVDASINDSNGADRLYLRVERQTLTKLPVSGAVIFTIRTHMRPLSALNGAQRYQFASILRSLPDAVAAYKGLQRTGAMALAALDDVR